MLLNRTRTYSRPTVQTKQANVSILQNAAVTIDQTVNFVVKHAQSFPGTIQETATVVPYLSVAENFNLFASRAHPKHRKTDLLVEDALAGLELSQEVLDQTFEELPLSLSLRLQWVLNRLCEKDVLIIGRWFWSLPDSDRTAWEDVFQAAAKENQLLILLSDDASVEIQTGLDCRQLTDLEELLPLFIEKQ